MESFFFLVNPRLFTKFYGVDNFIKAILQTKLPKVTTQSNKYVNRNELLFQVCKQKMAIWWDKNYIPRLVSSSDRTVPNYICTDVPSIINSIYPCWALGKSRQILLLYVFIALLLRWNITPLHENKARQCDYDCSFFSVGCLWICCSHCNYLLLDRQSVNVFAVVHTCGLVKVSKSFLFSIFQEFLLNLENVIDNLEVWY